MQVSIQRPTEGLEYVITVSVGSEGMTSAVEQRLKEIQKTVRMDGFRPGKVPMNMVRARHLQQVRAEALENVLYDSFFKAADQEQVRVAGILGFEEVSANDGEDIRFVTRFESYPVIDMPDFTAVSVEKVTAEIGDADVDDMIQRLREMRKTYVVADKAAESGDMVNLDFSGSIDGVKFDGGSAENVPLVLGSGRMIPGFEDGILGMNAGEQKVIDVTFPEGYQAVHLAGKTAQFDIKVNSVQETQLPEINEEFKQNVISTAINSIDTNLSNFNKGVITITNSFFDEECKVKQDIVFDILATNAISDVLDTIMKSTSVSKAINDMKTHTTETQKEFAGAGDNFTGVSGSSIGLGGSLNVSALGEKANAIIAVGGGAIASFFIGLIGSGKFRLIMWVVCLLCIIVIVILLVS
jgi:trigger factor